MIDKHLDLFYEHYKSQSKKSVVNAKNWCGAIAHRLRYDTSLPGNLRQDLIEIFSAGADGQSIDKYIGIMRPPGHPHASEEDLERNEKIWERMNELSDKFPTPKDRAHFVGKEFYLSSARIGQIYRERQKIQDDLDQAYFECFNQDVWEKVSELLAEGLSLSECCTQLSSVFSQDARLLEQIYIEQQKEYEKNKD